MAAANEGHAGRYLVVPRGAARWASRVPAGGRGRLPPVACGGQPFLAPGAAATGTLWTVGLLCVGTSRGLVPIAFTLLGVDRQVKVWFVARHLEPAQQMPVAAGFVVIGLIAILCAELIRRSRAGPNAVE